MIVVISAIAGAYGTHIAREFLLRGDNHNLWTQILFGALVGVFSGEVLNLGFPAVENTLIDMTASVYLGTVIPHIIFGTLGGFFAVIMQSIAGRIKAN